MSDILDLSKPKTILIYAQPGFGKTTMVKHVMSLIAYKHIYIITGEPYDYPEVNDEHKKTDVDGESLDEFYDKDGIKLLILDDILHLDLATGNNKRIMNRVISTSRHHNTYVIISTQLLNAIGKGFRLLAHIYMIGNIDEDSVLLMSNITKYKKPELRTLTLVNHQFLVLNKLGRMEKIRLVLNEHESDDD